MKKKVLVSTVPFCEYSNIPQELLSQESNIEVTLNPIGRKLTEDELADFIEPFHAIIAGTETISKKVLDRAKNLQVISRVGVGLDSVDLLTAREKNIAVAYTAEAPAPAVSELTLGLILDLCRHISVANQNMHDKKWKRFFGSRIEESVVGVIGCGRIGKRVVQHLLGFNPKKILICDLQKINLSQWPNVKPDQIQQVSFEELIAQSDIISVHVPLTSKTRNMINSDVLAKAKANALIVNTARGGIINENDLYQALKTKKMAGAAIDVFEVEPYSGPLAELNNCILTSHMGSMSYDCRTRMEIEATEDSIHFLKHSTLKQPVPEYEYDLKKT